MLRAPSIYVAVRGESDANAPHADRGVPGLTRLTFRTPRSAKNWGSYPTSKIASISTVFRKGRLPPPTAERP